MVYLTIYSFVPPETADQNKVVYIGMS